MTHQFSQDTASYFDLPSSPRPGTDGSTPISPGTIPSSLVKNTTRPSLSLLGFLSRRTRSDYDSVHKRVHVQAIEDDGPAYQLIVKSPLSQPESHNLPHAIGSDTDSTGGRRSSLEVPSSLEASHPTAKIPAKSASKTHAYPPRRPRIGHTWKRTQSGSVWFETQKSTIEDLPNLPSSSSHATNIPPDQLPVRRDQTPLAPPKPKPVSHSHVSDSSNIRVETPFSESAVQDVAEEEKMTKRKEKKVSFNPKTIFSVPFQSVRRLSRYGRHQTTGRSQEAPGASAGAPQSDVWMADHSSLLKRNYTSRALRRVNSVLQDPTTTASRSIWPASLKPLRSRAQTGASRGPIDVPIAQGLVMPNAMLAGKSDDAMSIRSYTSSQRAMLMGIQPSNTPEEKATYRIKRSASAETEEYLTVDISIRGGTSYLPSEARRIHTPPLPDHTQDGRLKGFFFDYNAPRSQTSLEPLQRRNTRTSKRAVGWKDWYDLKLAELDTPDESDLSSWPRQVQGIRQQELDENIPEHFPSSPLCPRNPRYWRVVQGKGNQSRSCWMHGTGEYEVVTGTNGALGLGQALNS
ncbi:hypothetical protein B0A52_09266 [Exophiala mesophila]|uniref:Uncharacterized protein n=1 Tax=Exophiala mesophila TaxID=212818 RepID=A0A438MU83_EXOME|nr:hypothetical protein B0A52_09266 [Exophiala mesophila]